MKLVLQITAGILLAAVIIGAFKAAGIYVTLSGLTRAFQQTTISIPAGGSPTTPRRQHQQPSVNTRPTKQRAYVAPRPLKECMNGKNLIDEAVMKCTKGYWIEVEG